MVVVEVGEVAGDMDEVSTVDEDVDTIFVMKITIIHRVKIPAAHPKYNM